jgi:hypothetical protein
MSDMFWTALFVFLGTVASAIATYVGAKGAKRALAAQTVELAANAETVSTKLATTVDSRAKKTDDKQEEILAGTKEIHGLVNSGSDKLKAEIKALKDELTATRQEMAAEKDRANAQANELATTINSLLERLLKRHKRRARRTTRGTR